MQHNFDVTTWIVQSILLMLALLLAAPAIKAILGIALLSLSALFPRRGLKLKKMGIALLPPILHVALGLSLYTTTPASATPPTDHATYVVQPGDSLWSIAHHRLQSQPNLTPQQVDAEWRRLWKINREAIGTDPTHLEIGTSIRIESQ
jgi:hypothetical protein